MPTTGTALNLDALRSAVEADDPHAIADAYAEDAVVETYNRDHGPGDPLVIRGRDALLHLHQDIASRGLTHTVERAVAADGHGALQIRCRYPDGMGVLCASTFDTADGRIVRETRFEVWDG